MQTSFKHMSPLLQFYNEKGTDQCGRYITDIWNFSLSELENVHDYIQWLFTTTDPSKYNTNVDVLTHTDIDEFIHGPLKYKLQNNLLISLRVMFTFYGLYIIFRNNSNIIVTRDKKHFRKRDQWITKDNHNFLRFSRILKSLTELGMKNVSDALLHCLLTEICTDPSYKNIISNKLYTIG